MDATETQNWLLVVNNPRGQAWTMILSRDSLRFVGKYARVPGIGDAEGLLRYRPCSAG
jgi:hypothetical protein